MAYTPTYVAGDLPAIGGDAVGTAGAAVVPWIPVAVGALVVYGGTKYAMKEYKKHKKAAKKGTTKKGKQRKSMSGKGWHKESYRHSMAARGIPSGKYKR